MAHMSHKLPWNSLSKNFEYTYQSELCDGRTNLMPPRKMLPQHIKSIEHFARVFHALVADNTKARHLKFKEECVVPPGGRIISKEVERKLKRSLDYAWTHSPVHSPMLSYSSPWLQAVDCRKGPFGSCCLHKGDIDIRETECDCIDLDPYDINIWSAIYNCSSCCGKYGRFQMFNLTKVFLTHNYLDPLYRVTRSSVKLNGLYSCYNDDRWQVGWKGIWKVALQSYLVLNILYTKPNIWPSESKDTSLDYRLTSAYQQMLYDCTFTTEYDIHTLPHRLFYGIRRETFQYNQWHTGREHSMIGTPSHGYVYSNSRVVSREFSKRAGHDTIEKVLKIWHGNDNISTVAQVQEIFSLLQVKGLPPELADEVMLLAGYGASTSRLRLPRDPLHPVNGVELQKYLSYCWRVVCSCDLLAKWCDGQINWQEEVLLVVYDLFCSQHGVLHGNRFDYFSGQLPYEGWLDSEPLAKWRLAYDSTL